jgi:ribosomal protein S12 methylthiotransferase accessory factor
MPDEQTTSCNRLLELVSDRIGLIRSLTFATRGADEPIPPVVCQAMLSHFDYRAAKPFDRAAGGKGRNKQEAIGSAIGEALERYCACSLDPRRIRRASFVALGGAAVPPDEFVLYSDTQYSARDFSYRRWNPQGELNWISACELGENLPVFVPAALVSMTPLPQGLDEFAPIANSNGMATGPTLEAAVLSGLCELIERDAFLIYWMNQLPAPELQYPNDGSLADTIRNHYARFGVEIRVFDITTDLPAYAMMAIALDHTSKGPAALVGLACDLDPGVALRKSLMEICQIRPGQVSRYRRNASKQSLKDYRDIQQMEDHSDFLAVPARLGEFDFLLNNGRKRDLRELVPHTTGQLHSDLYACATVLKAGGHRVIYADLTTPDVAEYGLTVVRALATGLQPMHFGYGQERLGGKRLFEVPGKLGYSSAPRTERDLNPCPHPLA